MRNLLIAVVTVALLAAPSLGVINIKLTADVTTLSPGGGTTVYVWAQGTTGGVYSLAGDIVYSGSGSLTAVPGSMVIDPAFIPISAYTAKPGTPGINGGWNNIGSLQSIWFSPDPLLGKDNYALFCKYTVIDEPGNFWGDLTFAPKIVSGFKPTETDKSTVIGTITPVHLDDVPEPLTIALLALGLAATRKRHPR